MTEEATLVMDPVGEGVRLSACEDPAGDKVGILEEVNRAVSCTAEGVRGVLSTEVLLSEPDSLVRRSALENTPWRGAHLKYDTPETEPSFLPWRKLKQYTIFFFRFTKFILQPSMFPQ